MKKIISVSIVFGMMLALSIVANAAPNDTPQADQGQPVVTGEAVISGANDKRVITPDMNYRERVETQRNIKKRAAAMRNQLMQQAEQERKNQPQPVPTGYPTAQ